MITKEQLPMVLDHPLFDQGGQKVGEVKHIFFDEVTSRPEWLCIKTGLFGMRETFVPLRDAEVVQDHVEVPYDKDRIKNAPNVDVDEGYLSPEQEQELYRYYGLPREPSGEAGDLSRESAGRGGTRPAEPGMTRSEEQLRIGREARESGHARLRKYVVTEEQQVNVPVSHEEVRVEREPIAEKDRGRTTGDLGEAEQEVTLHEERPTVAKETVPKEQVRMTKEQVTHEEPVSEEVRKERIEAEGDTDERGRGF